MWLKPRSFLEPEAEAWQLDAWKWLRGHGVGVGAKLILSTAAFFSATEKTSHDRVQHIFETVKHLAGMDDWACDLIEQLPDIDLRVNQSIFLKREILFLPAHIDAATILLKLPTTLDWSISQSN